jgi:hypothetical protein
MIKEIFNIKIIKLQNCHLFSHTLTTLLPCCLSLPPTTTVKPAQPCHIHHLRRNISCIMRLQPMKTKPISSSTKINNPYKPTQPLHIVYSSFDNYYHRLVLISLISPQSIPPSLICCVNFKTKRPCSCYQALVKNSNFCGKYFVRSAWVSLSGKSKRLNGIFVIQKSSNF